LGVLIGLFIFGFTFLNTSAQAARFTGFDPGQKGLGLLVGQPSGLRYESWVDWKDVWFFDLGYHTGQQAVLGVNYAFFAYDVKDYWQRSNTINNILFYYGPGIFAGTVFDPNETANKIRLGVKFFGGFQYMFGSGKYALRAEVGPAVNAFGDRFLELTGGLGFTYYFDRNYKKDTVPVGPTESLGGTGPSMSKTKKANGDGEFDLSDDERDGKVPNKKAAPATAPGNKAAPPKDGLKPDPKGSQKTDPKSRTKPVPSADGDLQL
jgi:hypothetical protein